MLKFASFLQGLILILSVQISYSQTNSDTLKWAQELSSQQNFTEAISILETYQNNHPNDVYSAELLANCLQWNGQYTEAESLYESSIKKYPNADFLVLDYARMKFEQAEYTEAKPLFESYLINNPTHIESHINLGYMAYWNGDFNSSKTHFETVLESYPENPTALTMMEKLNQITSPYVALGVDYGNDSQPMKTIKGKLEAGWYVSKYFKPVLNVDYMNFATDTGSNQVPWVRLSNQSNLWKGKTKVSLGLGYSQSVNKSDAVFSGFAEITQKITPKFSVTVKGESNPYFYSLASAFLPVSYNGISGTLIWRDSKTLDAQAGFTQQYFMDDNQLSTFYLWAVSRSFGFKKINFNVGYSYNFQDSKYNSFESIKPLGDIISGGDYDNIEGIYLPYFTPNNQNMHGIIGVINLFPENKIHFELKGNIGVFAYSDIPYLYLNNDDMTGATYFAKDYYRERKTTMELSASVGYQITQKIVLDASYVYTDNFFYTNNLVHINLIYRFK